MISPTPGGRGVGGAPGVNIPIAFTAAGSQPDVFQRAKADVADLKKAVAELQDAINGLSMPGRGGGGGGRSAPTNGAGGGGSTGGTRGGLSGEYERAAVAARQMTQETRQQVGHARELHALWLAIGTLMSRPIAHATGIPGGTREIMLLGRLAMAGMGAGVGGLGGGAGAVRTADEDIAARSGLANPLLGAMATGMGGAAAPSIRAAGLRQMAMMAGAGVAGGTLPAAGTTAGLFGLGAGGTAGVAGGLAAGALAIPALLTTQGQQAIGGFGARVGQGIAGGLEPGGFLRQYGNNLGFALTGASRMLGFQSGPGDWLANYAGLGLRPFAEANRTGKAVSRAEESLANSRFLQERFRGELAITSPVDEANRQSRLDSALFFTRMRGEGPERERELRRASAELLGARGQATQERIGRGELLPSEDTHASLTLAYEQRKQSAKEILQIEREVLQTQQQQVDSIRQQATEMEGRQQNARDRAASVAERFLSADRATQLAAVRGQQKIEAGQGAGMTKRELEAYGRFGNPNYGPYQDELTRRATARGGGAFVQPLAQTADLFGQAAAGLDASAKASAEKFAKAIKDAQSESTSMLQKEIPKTMTDFAEQLAALVAQGVQIALDRYAETQEAQRNQQTYTPRMGGQAR